MDYDKDYYGILGVKSNASAEEIKKTYRVLAKKYHPDVNQDEATSQLFKDIGEAYETLADERSRREYDEYRAIVSSEAYGISHGYTGDLINEKIKALILTFAVPGFFQIKMGNALLGYIILAIYYGLWLVAFSMSLSIAVLAILVWICSVIDAYINILKKSPGVVGE